MTLVYATLIHGPVLDDLILIFILHGTKFCQAWSIVFLCHITVEDNDTIAKGSF